VLHWYWIDLVIVSSSLVEIMVELTSDGSSKDDGSAQSMGNARMFRLLRVVRLAKVIRIVRLVRFVRSLRTLVLSIIHTLRAVVWACVLLSMIIYVFALMFVQTVNEHLQSSQTNPMYQSNRASLQMFWGTLPRSMFTLFKCIASGISWHEVVVPLADVGGMVITLFLLYISFTLFAVLNVITGVFCEAASSAAHADYENAVQQHLQDKDMFLATMRQVFGLTKDHEVDGSMHLAYGDLENILMNKKTKAYMATLDLDVTDAWELFKLLDTDESAMIDVDEFLSGILRLKGMAKSIDMAKLGYDNKMRERKTFKVLKIMENKISELHDDLEHAQLHRQMDSDAALRNFNAITSPTASPTARAQVDVKWSEEVVEEVAF